MDHTKSQRLPFPLCVIHGISNTISLLIPQNYHLNIFLGAKDLAVDVGAGTGQASGSLAKFFTKVIAFDPSLSPSEENKHISTFFIIHLANIYKPT